MGGLFSASDKQQQGHQQGHHTWEFTLKDIPPKHVGAATPAFGTRVTSHRELPSGTTNPPTDPWSNERKRMDRLQEKQGKVLPTDTRHSPTTPKRKLRFGRNKGAGTKPPKPRLCVETTCI